MEIGIVRLPALFSFSSISVIRIHTHKRLTNMVDFGSWIRMEKRTGRKMKEREIVTKGGDWLRDGGVERRWGVDSGLGRDFVLLCV